MNEEYSGILAGFIKETTEAFQAIGSRIEEILRDKTELEEQFAAVAAKTGTQAAITAKRLQEDIGVVNDMLRAAEREKASLSNKLWRSAREAACKEIDAKYAGDVAQLHESVRLVWDIYQKLKQANQSEKEASKEYLPLLAPYMTHDSSPHLGFSGGLIPFLSNSGELRDLVQVIRNIARIMDTDRVSGW